MNAGISIAYGVLYYSKVEKGFHSLLTPLLVLAHISFPLLFKSNEEAS